MTLKALESSPRAALALLLIGLVALAPAVGERLAVPPSPPAAAASGARPERGSRMEAVEQRYGAPTTRYPAVGQPPITRWDYPSMVVFFEGDRVIHTVLVAPAG